MDPTRTILVAEDEPDLVEIIVRTLARGGYTVLTAHSGREALRIAATHAGPIDLLVTDVVMPGMDGPELVRRARELFPHLSVVVLSGYADRPTFVGPAGSTVFLQKPFELSDLLDRVRELLGDRA